MSNLEIKRDHNGTMHLHVAGVPALGATVTAITTVNGEMGAVVFVPLKLTLLGEIDRVIPSPIRDIETR
jgi:hypothetical protein